MKLRTLGLVALVATLGLASCKKEEGPQVDQEPKSVTIKLANVKPVTRATVSDGITNGDKVVLNNYNIYFVKGTNTLVQVGKDINNADITKFYYTDDGTGTTGKNESIVFHFLPADVNAVVILGNVGDQTGKFTSLSALKATALNISNGTLNGNEYTNQDCSKLPLYGYAEIEKTAQIDSKNHPLYEAEVTLYPLVSRIEVESFFYDENPENNEGTVESTASNYVPKRKYEEVTIDQMVLNDYFTSATFAGSGNPVYGAVPTDADNVNTFITKEGVWEFFTSAPEGWTNYVFTTASAATISLVAADSPAWTESYTDKARPAFNFFPNTANIETVQSVADGTGDHPQLVVKLTGKKGTATTPHYLATKTFIKDSEAQMSKDVAKVYKMTFKFNDKNLGEPEKCVEVNVSVATWQVIEVTPEF